MISSFIKSIQDFLDFKCFANPQFSSPGGLGRVGILGTALGISLGFHLFFVLLLLLQLFEASVQVILLQWSLYIIFLSMFHLSEFFVTAIYNPKSLTADSFIVNHSEKYTIAVFLSFFEFWVEALLVPSMKRNQIIVSFIGLVMVICGSACRLVAMASCGPNFNHIIQSEQTKDHKLVTHGIYAYLRHPSYFGWFYWSIGTQLLLCNPICSILYCLTGWIFFRHRIPFEEETLQRQYPNQYPSYMDHTIIGLPFIYSTKLLSGNCGSTSSFITCPTMKSD